MSDSRKFTLDLWGSLCFRLGVSVDLACSGTSCRCSVVLGSVESGGRVNTLSSLACSLLSSLWQAWQGGVSLLCDVRLIIVWVCVVCQSNPRFASKTLASKFQISVVQFTYTVVLLLTVQWLIKKKKRWNHIECVESFMPCNRNSVFTGSSRWTWMSAIPIITGNQAGRPGTSFKACLPYAWFSVEFQTSAEYEKKKPAREKWLKPSRQTGSFKIWLKYLIAHLL